MKTQLIVYFLLLFLVMGCNEPDSIQLEHKVLAKGKPTIIFENGMASTFETWKSIPDSIAKTNSVLLYNRSGLGNSEIRSEERNIPNMVDDLNQLLEMNELEGPFILVAHSMGSYLSRYFALQHPDQIKGILLVDPSPDKMYDAYTEKETEDFLAFGDENFKNSNDAVKKEWNNYLPNRKYVQEKLSDDFPIIIISATQWDFYNYHQSILNKNPNSKHLKVEGGHDLHHEKPELIIEQIRYLTTLP